VDVGCGWCVHLEAIDKHIKTGEQGCVSIKLWAREMWDILLSKEVSRPGGCGHNVGRPCLFRVMYSSQGTVGPSQPKKKTEHHRDIPVSMKR